LPVLGFFLREYSRYLPDFSFLIMTSSPLKFDPQQDSERSEDAEIDAHVLGKTPVLARVTKAPAGDIKAANFRGNRGDEEDRNERSQDRQCAAIEETENQAETAEDFQPWQIKREPDSDRPGQNFVIVDVVGELDWIERLNPAGINENGGNDKIDNAPEKFHRLSKRPTLNAQQPTPNFSHTLN
jgi:hypothetical protein